MGPAVRRLRRRAEDTDGDAADDDDDFPVSSLLCSASQRRASQGCQGCLGSGWLVAGEELPLQVLELVRRQQTFLEQILQGDQLSHALGGSAGPLWSHGCFSLRIPNGDNIHA